MYDAEIGLLHHKTPNFRFIINWKELSGHIYCYVILGVGLVILIASMDLVWACDVEPQSTYRNLITLYIIKFIQDKVKTGNTVAQW